MNVDYEPGSRGLNGHFNITADTPKGRFVYKRELPMELQSEDGLDFECTLGGVIVDSDGSGDDLPDFDEPPTANRGATLFAAKAKEIVRSVLTTWLKTQATV